MKKPPLILASLALLLLAGCPPSIIDLSYAPPAGSSGSATATTTSGTVGSGGGGTGGAGTGGMTLCMPGATTSCYDGPAGTEGVGICRAGTQTCAADGASWGACTGEVLPQMMEDCASGMDQNCDGTVAPCMGVPLWSEHFGDSSSLNATSAGVGIASDPGGNVILTGEIEGSVDFGGGPLIGAGNYDLFVTKLDPNGAFVWSKRFGDAKGQSGASVATDAAGNIVVTGSFAGQVDFGLGALVSAGGDDIFIAKLDPNGAALWSKRFGDASPGEQAGFGVAVDGAGYVIASGIFSGTVDFGGGPLTSAPTQDIFVVKLDPSGVHQWSKHFAGVKFAGISNDMIGGCVAVDSAGDVIVSGVFSGTVDFGGGPLTSAGSQDVFVVKLAPGGAYLWSKHFGYAGGTAVHVSVSVDSADNLVLGGGFTGQIDFGGPTGPLTSAGGRDIFLAEVDPGGAYRWAKRFGDSSPNEQLGTSVRADSSGAVVLTGYFGGTVDFGGGQLTSIGDSEIFLAKFAPDDGGHLWSRRFSADKADTPTSVTTDPTDDVLITGGFTGTVDLGGGPFTAIGGDIFVAKFGP